MFSIVKIGDFQKFTAVIMSRLDGLYFSVILNFF